MEKHYTKNMGEITYVYGVDLEEHNKVIEKQQKRIAELEKDLEFTTKTANELIEIKHKLEQELAELKEKAITTHFKLGQEIWFVGYSSIQSWIIKGIELKYIKDKLCEICRLGHHGTDDYSCCVMPFDSDRCFATEQEAQAKLKEIQGK